MIRTRCEECGVWHRGELAFCPCCGTLHAGTVARPSGPGLYTRAWSHFWRKVLGSLRGRRTPAALLDWLGALASGLLDLIVSGARWRPVMVVDRVSYDLLDTVPGLDVARLARLSAWLTEAGFEKDLAFTVPEEHEPAFYQLYRLPGEHTWALARLPSPAALDAARWEVSFHSLLCRGGALVTRSFEAEQAPPLEGVEFLAACGRPQEVATMHRQELFRRGGARQLPRTGAFLRHFAGVLNAQFGARRYRRGRGPDFPRSDLRSPWATVVGSCAHCAAPVTADRARKLSSRLLCLACCPDEPPVRRSRKSPVARRAAAAFTDLSLATLLAAAASFVLIHRVEPVFLILLVPLLDLAHTLLTRGATAGRRLARLRVAPDNAFRLFLRCTARWVTPGWHDHLAGTWVTPLSPREPEE